MVYDPQQLKNFPLVYWSLKGDLKVVEASQIDLIDVPGLAHKRGVSDWIWWRLLRSLFENFVVRP